MQKMGGADGEAARPGSTDPHVLLKGARRSHATFRQKAADSHAGMQHVCCRGCRVPAEAMGARKNNFTFQMPMHPARLYCKRLEYPRCSGTCMPCQPGAATLKICELIPERALCDRVELRHLAGAQHTIDIQQDLYVAVNLGHTQDVVRIQA